MPGFTCNIVPPYLLESLADDPNSQPHVREMAISTLAHATQSHQERHRYSLQGPRAGHTYPQASGYSQQGPHSIVPDYILQQFVDDEHVDDEARRSARDTLSVSGQFRRNRAAAATVDKSGRKSRAGGVPPQQPVFNQEIFDMEHNNDTSQLPGSLVRREGDGPVTDVAANDVYDNTLVVLKFFRDVFKYNSLDGDGHPVTSSVHFGHMHGNAWWQFDPDLGQKQMVYGDGDGRILGNFVKALDVIGHEITHGITQFNSSLLYEHESGALNEHLSDVFGILVKQKFENKTADAADWLIGEACFIPSKKGVAFRNMLRPGTAFPGDPQIDHYSKIQETKDKFPDLMLDVEDERSDNGGVHYFSGIPNKAFALVAKKFGGFAWKKAGRIWWHASITKKASIPPSCTFIQFADVTVESAYELFGADAANVVRDAWNQVGVTRSH